MPEGDIPPPKTGGKVGGFLNAQTAGLPNWAWLLVIAAGIAAAVIIPRMFRGSGTKGEGEIVPGSGLGLAIDPTTGLPYAVEGLVPSGAFAGGGTTTQTTQTNIPPQKQNVFATIRNKATKEKEPFFGADKGQKGVFTRTSPSSGTQGRVIPYGSKIQITGPGVVGQATKTTGSNVWYPVTGGGYLSSQDITSLDAGATGGDTDMPVKWPYAEATPHTLAAMNGISDSKLYTLNQGMYNDSVLHQGERYSR